MCRKKTYTNPSSAEKGSLGSASSPNITYATVNCKPRYQGHGHCINNTWDCYPEITRKYVPGSRDRTRDVQSVTRVPGHDTVM